MLLLWVLLNDGWLDKSWTQNPIFVQSLSTPCPMSVQTRRLYRVCPVDVKCQSRSRPIPQPLDRDWTWKSRVCPKADQQLNIRRWNSSYSTKFGQSLILDKLWTSVRLKMLAIIIYLSVDKVRTNFGHGQTLDSVWIPNSVQMTCKPWLRRLLCYLDIGWTNFGYGQTLDKVWISSPAPKSNLCPAPQVQSSNDIIEICCDK